MTARQSILKTLALAPEPLPIHKLDIFGVSQTAVSARLRELAREGLVVGQVVPGHSYKAWSLPKDGQQVFSI